MLRLPGSLRGQLATQIDHSHFSRRVFKEMTSLTITRRKKGKSKFLTLNRSSIERDAQLLANRIALLKQEEMKTWKKIEETKKRTKEISDLKKRNDEKM